MTGQRAWVRPPVHTAFEASRETGLSGDLRIRHPCGFMMSVLPHPGLSRWERGFPRWWCGYHKLIRKGAGDMKVLVTGGAGLAGTAIADDLVSHGHEVVRADRNAPPDAPHTRG